MINPNQLLLKLRLESGLSFKQVSRLSNIASDCTLWYIETNKKTPMTSTFFKLTSFYGVEFKADGYDIADVRNTLRKARKAAGLTVMQAAVNYGIGVNTLSRNENRQKNMIVTNYFGLLDMYGVKYEMVKQNEYRFVTQDD